MPEWGNDPSNIIITSPKVDRERDELLLEIADRDVDRKNIMFIGVAEDLKDNSRGRTPPVHKGFKEIKFQGLDYLNLESYFCRFY